MTKSLVTHWLGQMPLSGILVPFESIVNFLTHGWYLVIGFCVACYACTCFSVLIGCWMDDVAHVCKVFDVRWWIPLFAWDGLKVVKFLWGPWVHKLRSWSSYMWRLKSWNPHLWWYVGTHSYGVLSVVEILGLEPTYMVVWCPLDVIWSLECSSLVIMHMKPIRCCKLVVRSLYLYLGCWYSYGDIYVYI